ncbi:MAG: N-acetyltransferase [Microbacteriaceae bacterium]|nr:N-acetyltransferase [Microbacteriaceae bacterium]
MTAVRPDHSPLLGRVIRLDALLESDLPALHRAIAYEEVFAGGFGGGPLGYRRDPEDFVAWALRYFQWEAGNVYAVRLVGGEHDGVIVGTTTLGYFDVGLEHAEVGWTAFDPAVWGSAVNAEAKLLLLGLAFASGFGRVQIEADERNERSRRAIAKLGARFEGIKRRDRRRADGSWRNSAIFSVTIDDWPAVRAGLESRLVVAAAQPVSMRRSDDAGAR